jgi:serine/threonine-protein kinase
MIKKGKLRWRESISYCEQILNALKQVHSKGIIHRDIKPQNIMLLRNGNLKITDFGIAKMQGSEPLTMTNKAIGTVHYISPEQAGKGNVTNVSDIYSTGVLLYEMITGELPFNHDNPLQVAMMHVTEAPKNPRMLNPEIPKGLAQITLKAMSKTPRDRYQSAGDMIGHLNILSANPAVVFNNMNNIEGGSNLPVPVGNGSGAGNRSLEPVNGRRRTEMTVAGGRQVKNRNIDEDEMRKRGRSSKKTIKRKNSRSMFPFISGITLAFLIVLAISGVQIFLAIWKSDIVEPSGEDITIPDYIGKVYNQKLLDEMQELKLSVGKYTYEINDNFGENQIISQLPEPKEIKRLAAGAKSIPITFVISKGKYSYVVEDLAITDARETRIFLESMRLVVKTEDIAHDTVPATYVIYTDPTEGTLLTAGDTIILYVSKGQDQKNVIMPDLVKSTLEQARKELSAAQIYIKSIKMEYSDVIEAGKIIEQDINPFKPVPRKSTRVNLKVSLGPKPTEPPPVP